MRRSALSLGDPLQINLSMSWQLNTELVAFLKAVCSEYNTNYKTTLKVDDLPPALMHKLEGIVSLYPDQGKAIGQAVEMLEQQFLIFISRVIDDENRERAPNDRLSVRDVSSKIGTDLRNIYLTTEYVGFAVKEANRFINRVYPVDQKTRLGYQLQEIIKTSKSHQKRG